MSVFRSIFRSRRVFRPEVEAMLDAELKRHNEQLRKLVAYAVEQENTQAETTGEVDGGTNQRAVRRPGSTTTANVDDATADGRANPG